MAINWNVEKIADHETVTTHPKESNRWRPVTDRLVMLSIPCGFNHITEDNAEEVAGRIFAYEALLGDTILLNDPTQYEQDSAPITLKDVRAHIGLTTNASAKSKRQWGSDLIAAAERRREDLEGNREGAAEKINALYEKLAEAEKATA